MKKLLIGILTLLMFIALVCLGLVFNVKNLIVDTVDVVLKKEITNEIVDYIGDNTNYNKDEVKKSIDKVLSENESIKKTVNTYMDKFMDIMNDKKVENIDLSKELESIINDSEPILKEYGITISEKDKQEILEAASSEEINKAFNETITEFKTDMPSEAKMALDIFNFVTSTTFKLILIGSIVLILILIAILKKSYYKWLSNFGGSLILSGIIIGLLIPIAIDAISKELEDGIVLSYNSFSTYGYISIGIGIVAIILNIVIPKIINKNKQLES